MAKSIIFRRTVRWSVIALALVGAAALVFYMTINSGAVVRAGSIYVPTGATYSTLLDSLGRDGERIKSMETFRRAARLTGLDGRVRPGRYVLREGMTYRAVVRMFRNGVQTPVKLVFNNIRTIDRLAGAVARYTESDSVTYYRLFTSNDFTEKYGFEPQTFIAMFIPNTYEVYWNITPAALCDKMKKEYDKFWTPERTQKLQTLGLDKVQVATLASIVYEETKAVDEMPRVAGVYINRLRIGMPLQADPTLKFAVGDFTLRRVLDRHKAVDSPYNTYMYNGLPPGPICMPSIKALDAVLNYERHNYIYFCAAPDYSGKHKFATNLAEHNRNRDEYIQFLNREGIR